MSILLGNLSTTEIEHRCGVTFPGELKDYMAAHHQDKAEKIAPGHWHCFDVPFTLVCGDRDTATEIVRHLNPMSSQFKVPLAIAVS